MSNRLGGRPPRRRRRLAAATAVVFVAIGVYGAAPALAVSNPTVTSISTPAAGATGVAYTIRFTTVSGQLAFPDTITLTGPAGTFTNAGFNVVDVTDGNRNLGVGQVSNNGSTVVLRVGSSTPTNAGDVIEVRVTGAANSAPGNHSIAVSTSDEPTPATTPTYSLVPAGAVSNTTFATSTTAAGATGVSYTIGFKTSSTGQLVFPGTITLTGPAGTFTDASFNVVDVTDGNRNLGVGQLSNNGATVVLRIGTATPTNPGDVIEVRVTGARNATTGSPSINVSTSSDTAATTPSFTVTPAQAITSTTFATSTTAAGATGVAYTIGFKTSSTGQLLFPGTITLTGPAGTFTDASFNVLDVTDGNRNLGVGQLSNNGATVVLRVGNSPPTNPGDVIQVRVTGARNSTAGQHAIEVDTSSDTPATAPAYTLTTAQTVTNATLTASSTAAGATGVAYTIGFKTSSTGQLLFPGTITLTGPAGTFTDASFNVLDVSDGNRNLGVGELSNNGSTVVLRVGNSTPTAPGDVIEVRVTGARNGPNGLEPLSVSTSSDPTPVVTGSGSPPPSSPPRPSPPSPPPPAREVVAPAQEALEKPALAKTVNVEVVRGQVFVSVPSGGAARASQSVPGIKGRRFVPLSQARTIPVGSLLDTRRGTVRLTSARDASGATQSSEFLSGVFQVLQSRSGLTELRMKGSSFRSCTRSARKSSEGGAQAAARRRSKRTIRRLRGNGSGRFRTRGRYSAATVRGTDWTVSDRCDGTLTKVRRGKVAVRDFRRRKSVTVRAGKRYLALAPR